MTPKRTVVVTVAVGVGLVAAVLSYVFLNDAQQRAYHNAKLVSAYVITKPVPRTLSGADAVNLGYISRRDIPAEFRPSTAVTNLTLIQGKQAIAPFSVGQVLVSSMFVSPAAVANAFSQQIKPGFVAVTISVDQVHGVAGLPVPGDNVDLLVSASGAENFLLQNVPILAIGQATAASSSQNSATTTAASTTSGLYTFEVRPADAERIALAQQQNLGIYLLLVPANNPVVSVPGVDPGNILNGPQTSG
jgi:Flp pilus assembly protein CpaB